MQPFQEGNHNDAVPVTSATRSTEQLPPSAMTLPGSGGAPSNHWGSLLITAVSAEMRSACRGLLSSLVSPCDVAWSMQRRGDLPSSAACLELWKVNGLLMDVEVLQVMCDKLCWVVHCKAALSGPHSAHLRGTHWRTKIFVPTLGQRVRWSSVNCQYH